MLHALGMVAPGTPLREGFDRILQSGMGALIVVGDGPDVLNICSGGFLLDAAYSPQRLSELAKMDGAIVLASNASRIARANVHLVPKPNVPTSETGTRHRTAERVARSITVPVISVSEDMSIIAVYVGDEKHQLMPIPRLLDRANQAMKTLERYKERLVEVSNNLIALEVQGAVTVRDVVVMLQRTEMVLRIAEEIEFDIVELGVDGRLFRLQLEEVIPIKKNGTFLVIGAITDVFIASDWIEEDGFIDLEKAKSITSLGIDGYYNVEKIDRLPYAKP
jgi:diadenylate cyclase